MIISLNVSSPFWSEISSISFSSKSKMVTAFFALFRFKKINFGNCYKIINTWFWSTKSIFISVKLAKVDKSLDNDSKSIKLLFLKSKESFFWNSIKFLQNVINYNYLYLIQLCLDIFHINHLIIFLFLLVKSFPDKQFYFHFLIIIQNNYYY